MVDEKKTLKTRIQLKSDTETNWNKAGPKNGSNGFVPLLGELIVYEEDATHHFSRLKVGNGKDNVISLPFVDAGTVEGKTIPIPESEIYTYASRADFPEEGEENKFYVDETNNRIFYYNVNSNKWSQLSNFNYKTTTSPVSTITNWDRGEQTSIYAEKGKVYVTNGRRPTLTYHNTTEAIVSITKEVVV